MIDQNCERFEAAWLAGTPRPVEEFVRAAPESVQAELFRELFRIEQEYRKRANRVLTSDEAQRQYLSLGSWAGVIVAEELETAPPASDPLASTISHEEVEAIVSFSVGDTSLTVPGYEIGARLLNRVVHPEPTKFGRNRSSLELRT